jgi:hypothetical protein
VTARAAATAAIAAALGAPSAVISSSPSSSRSADGGAWVVARSASGATLTRFFLCFLRPRFRPLPGPRAASSDTSDSARPNGTVLSISAAVVVAAAVAAAFAFAGNIAVAFAGTVAVAARATVGIAGTAAVGGTVGVGSVAAGIRVIGAISAVAIGDTVANRPLRVAGAIVAARVAGGIVAARVARPTPSSDGATESLAVIARTIACVPERRIACSGASAAIASSSAVACADATGGGSSPHAA